jgi:hypothetical protein
MNCHFVFEQCKLICISRHILYGPLLFKVQTRYMGKKIPNISLTMDILFQNIKNHRERKVTMGPKGSSRVILKAMNFQRGDDINLLDQSYNNKISPKRSRDKSIKMQRPPKYPNGLTPSDSQQEMDRQQPSKPMKVYNDYIPHSAMMNKKGGKLVPAKVDVMP